MDKNIKVLQFVDHDIYDLINKGYFGDKHVWNPQNQIMLLRPEDKLPAGVVLNEPQIIGDEGMSTFIQNPDDTHNFICVKKFGTTVMAKRQQVLLQILGMLGIHQYFVKTYFKLDANFGLGSNKKGKFNASSPDGKINRESEDNRTIGFDIGGEYLKAEHLVFDPNYNHDVKNYEEAKRLAEEHGLYDELSGIIENRRAGEGNSSLLQSEEIVMMDGHINVNINIAKSLSMLGCFSGVAEMAGSCCSLFNFNAALHGHYETQVIYNFSKENYQKIEDTYNKYEDYINNFNQK